MSSLTTDIRSTSIFLWLKKFADEKSTLKMAKPEFVSYVKKCCLVLHFCFQHYLSERKIIASLLQNLEKYVPIPKYCSQAVGDKVAALIVRTLLFHKLKWINDTVRDTRSNGKAKLKKILHE